MKYRISPGLLVWFVAGGACGIWNLFYSDGLRVLWDGSKYFEMGGTRLKAGASWYGEVPGARIYTDVGYPYWLSFAFSLLGQHAWVASSLNALLWAFTAALAHSCCVGLMPPRWALGLGMAVACSPLMTSYSPKIYPEILATFFQLLMTLGWIRYSHLHDKKSSMALAWGALIGLGLVGMALTKSERFPLMVLLLAVAAFFRWWRLSGFLAGLVLLVLPYHLIMQKNGRGQMAINGQVGRVLVWDYPMVGRCAVYSLSQNLGRIVFPQVENDCDPFWRSADEDPGGKIYARMVYATRNRQGLGYPEALPVLLGSPLKYIAVSVVNLLGAVWIEGLNGAIIDQWPGYARAINFLVFRVFLSTALWGLAIYGMISWAARKDNWPVAVALVLPIFTVLALSLIVLGEARYFYSNLPGLYILAALGAQKIWGVPKKRPLSSLKPAH